MNILPEGLKDYELLKQSNPFSVSMHAVTSIE